MRTHASIAVSVVCLVCSATLRADTPEGARSKHARAAKEFNVAAERFELPNGLVVVLSPDDSVNTVAVNMGFAAGALYEPPAKHGLAHLTEHVLSSGPTEATNYQLLLERRGAFDFNARTTIDRMEFFVSVPPEELPLALWVAADRLATLPGVVTEADVRRSAPIVREERLMRVDDVPYGASDVQLMRNLFPPPHPLNETIHGTPASLDTVHLEDVRAFAARYLVPANGVLTVVGRFDPSLAKQWLERTVARLEPGAPAPPPLTTPLVLKPMRVSATEMVSRRPRVMLAWTLREPLRDTSDALLFGATLLSIYTDGFVGLHVSAAFTEFAGGALFLLAVTMPHTTGKLEAGGNAEVVLRYLTRATLPEELVDATFQAWDRRTLTMLESPLLVAQQLSMLELMHVDVKEWSDFSHRHWKLTPQRIQNLAGVALRAPRLELHSRPLRPLPERVRPE